MKKYIKDYMGFHGIGEQDIIMCKYCNKRQAVDIHHITFKSQGGSDEVKNLISLCRSCHEDAHDKKISKEELYAKNAN